jgi:hypothetical protein
MSSFECGAYGIPHRRGCSACVLARPFGVLGGLRACGELRPRPDFAAIAEVGGAGDPSWRDVPPDEAPELWVPHLRTPDQCIRDGYCYATSEERAESDCVAPCARAQPAEPEPPDAPSLDEPYCASGWISGTWPGAGPVSEVTWCSPPPPSSCPPGTSERRGGCELLGSRLSRPATGLNRCPKGRSFSSVPAPSRAEMAARPVPSRPWRRSWGGSYLGMWWSSPGGCIHSPARSPPQTWPSSGRAQAERSSAAPPGRRRCRSNVVSSSRTSP